jgi:two-component system, NtrC family, response regulator AtoC
VLLTVGNIVNAYDLTLREPPRLVLNQDQSEKTLEEAERVMIIQVLKKAKGNVTVAAQKLGITRDTLRYRMQRHDLKRESYA